MRPLLAAAVFVTAIGAQPRGFEVASIHPSQLPRAGGEGSKRNDIRHTPKSLTMRNVTLLDCLMFAYGVPEQQVTGPDWIMTERYDIAASVSEPASRDELKNMLQPLLADRFKLALHRDTKDLPVYALVAAKSGSKLERSQSETGSHWRIAGGAFIFEDTTMSELAQKLSQLSAVNGLVIDQTGISGSFNFSVRMAASDEIMRADAIHGDAPSIFPLIERQLGLKLESRRVPMEVLIIDHAERIPTEN
jgi:uncharacterized protein (TIGR03435 family)